MYSFIVILIAALVGFIIYKRKSTTSTIDPTNTADILVKLIAPVGVGVVATFIVLSIQPYTIHRVDAGNVGIEFHLTGGDRGVSRYEYASGYVVYNTWFVKLYEFPTYQRHVTYQSQKVISKGGLVCEITPSFNYKLKAGDVGDMFVNLRLPIDQIEHQWLENAVAGTINDVANKWQVDSIFNHREAFEANVVASVNDKLKRWFEVSQLRTNIEPPQSLLGSIEAKTKALQDVIVAENEKRVAIADGLTRTAKAKADSSVAVTEAAGEARAIRERQLSLTPLYIEYLKIDKWDGKLPSTQLGGNSPVMVGLK